MISRLRHTGLVRGFSALGSGLIDSFLRGNRVLPPVLALLGLVIFSWIAAGLFLGGPKEERATNQANVVAQSQNDVGQADSGNNSPAPEAESRDAESYAAYQSKDPFRQLFSAADTGTTGEATTSESTTSESTTSEDTSSGNPGGDGSSTNGSGGETTGGGTGSGRGGGSNNNDGTSRGAQDSDNDGLSNRRERALGTDPNNPDSDADGIRDGADDSNGDGIPDRRQGGSGSGSGSGAGNNSGGRGGGNGNLFDSGGNLP